MEKDALTGLCQLSMPPPPPRLRPAPASTPPSSSSSSSSILSIDQYALFMGRTIRTALPIPTDIRQWGLEKEWEASKSSHRGLEVQLKFAHGIVKAIPAPCVEHKSTSILIHAGQRMKYEVAHYLRTAELEPLVESEHTVYFIASKEDEHSIVVNGALPHDPVVLFCSTHEAAIQEWWYKKVSPVLGVTYPITIIEARVYLSMQQGNDSAAVKVDDLRKPTMFLVRDPNFISFRYAHHCEFRMVSSSFSASSS